MLIVLASPREELWSKLVMMPLKDIFFVALELSGKSSKAAVPRSPVVNTPSTKVAVSPEAESS